MKLFIVGYICLSVGMFFGYILAALLLLKKSKLDSLDLDSLESLDL